MSRAHVFILLFFILNLLLSEVGFPANNYTQTKSTATDLSTSDTDSTVKRRNIFKDTANYFFIYVKDSWYILSSPARINKRGALWLGGTLLASGAVYAYDDEIMNTLHRNKGNAVYDFCADAGHKVEPLGLVKTMNPYYAIGAVTGYVLKIKPLEDISIQLHEALLIGSFSRRLVVFAAGRARPYECKGPYSFGNPKGRSFFSGHTASAFEMATILSHHVDYLPFTILCYGFSTAMGFQRLDTNCHWPSDVLLGAVYGTVVAKTIIKLHEKRNIKIAPSFSKNHVGIGITYFIE